MRALPEAVRPKLPKPLRSFEVASRAWLVQLYYDSPHIHYEVWNLGERRGRLEIGLHFEADKSTNDLLLEYFEARTFEVHAELGPRIEIERWTNSWTRVHEVVAYARSPWLGSRVRQVYASPRSDV